MLPDQRVEREGLEGLAASGSLAGMEAMEAMRTTMASLVLAEELAVLLMLALEGQEANRSRRLLEMEIQVLASLRAEQKAVEESVSAEEAVQQEIPELQGRGG